MKGLILKASSCRKRYFIDRSNTLLKVILSVKVILSMFFGGSFTCPLDFDVFRRPNEVCRVHVLVYGSGGGEFSVPLFSPLSHPFIRDAMYPVNWPRRNK